MKIKLSKSQWEEMGKKANWVKESQGRMDREEIENYTTTGAPLTKTPQRKQFVVRIDCEGAAFNPDPSTELYRLLEEIKTKVMAGEFSGNLLDVNGNTVGEFKLK